MNHLFKKLSLTALLLLPLLCLLLLARPVTAQTDPTATPEGGYPPPATPAQPDESYPLQRPTILPPEQQEGYIPPTLPTVATNPPTIVGESAPEATAVSTLPISQSTLVRNRLILWAGFLVTLFIFGLAVYGAILMYTRPRD
ncbi:MAG: hypothetical protein WAS33_19445 [Candidatus Promineifilaceae bacterium]|nr:hypothetical protein [Anaerolineaceae bacterium]